MAIYTSKDLSRTGLQRRTAEGRLQRIAPGLYSDDTTRTVEEVVAREWRAILARALPGAVITYANAFTGLPAGGELNVSHTRRNPLVLPGLTIRPDMAGRREPDDIPIGDNIWMASPARALIDNSTDHPGRPNQRITKATRGQLHDHIVQLTNTTRPDRLDELLRQVTDRAPRAVGAGIQAFFEAARAEINTVDTPSRALQAAQRGERYDRERVALFHDFAARLADKAPVERPDTLPGYTAAVSFFEAYFSNFIEGTEFTVEEAEQIVFDHADLGRPEDAHDILGTYELTSSPAMRVVAGTPDEFLDTLRVRHAVMMAARPAQLPGQWKDRGNRAGATEFVAPELVPGTLRAGWEEGQVVDGPFRQAVYLMFLVSEVHPFVDGNGRSARLAMNTALVAAGEHRIIIPTILRLDYLSALSRATNRGGPDALYRVLDFAQRWVSRGDWSTVDAGLSYAHATNALIDARVAERDRLHLGVPVWSAIGTSQRRNPDSPPVKLVE
ncbi:MAG TPA: Fic family protein [Propionicimonas sp.]|nr:Fic family protein [Propionicimonas sp.]HRA06753.1 Fic family protein [Propionicimonas sp.]